MTTDPVFEPSDRARVYACPPGVDFPAEVVEGLRQRFAQLPPEALARCSVYVNSGRMARRIKECFHGGAATFLPRIRLITEIPDDFPYPAIPAAVPDLRRHLELRQLVARRVELGPTVAPRSAVPDMTASLARLMDEMSEEGVNAEALRSIDVAEHSEHWSRSLDFLEIVGGFCGPGSTHPPSAAQRLRLVAEALLESWASDPPDHPIIIAGSTGSRGTTALLMQAVANLPNGALILPGFDFDLPGDVWPRMVRDDGLPEEDHPQFRFAHLMEQLGISHSDIQPWSGRVTAPQAHRNRLLSLALRPAPVTSQWMEEAPLLAGLDLATQDMALIEADTPRKEAVAISLVIRNALNDGRSAALITPDQVLTRLVTAALDRWGIVPDTSIGRQLHASTPGRLMRHVLLLSKGALKTAGFLALVKNPIVCKSTGRIEHLVQVRAFELWLRRRGIAEVSADTVDQWRRSENSGADPTWTEWISRVLLNSHWPMSGQLETFIGLHVLIATSLAKGHRDDGNDLTLWEEAQGKALLGLCNRVRAEAQFGGEMDAAEYAALFESLLQRTMAQDPVQPRSDVVILGTLEARAQNADVVILGGLNEGTWPEAPTADPWLNRAMRIQAGLLLPERAIGLAAHDFQQAAAARSVVLTRSKRDADAETVPSRWLNRLTNLLGGIPQGKVALEKMTLAGRAFLEMAEQVERPESAVPAASRPAPRPPKQARPRTLTVTEIQTLIRDPYAIYARHVLGLRPIDPLNPQPDQRLRGTLLHKIVEQGIPALDLTLPDDELVQALSDFAERVFGSDQTWPEIMTIWLGRFRATAHGLVRGELQRQSQEPEVLVEVKGRMEFPTVGITIVCKADRIDMMRSGTAVIYDYKSRIKGKSEIEKYEKQLWIEAVILEEGGFGGLEPTTVEKVGFIGFDSKSETLDFPMTPGDAAMFREHLLSFLSAYLDPTLGYVSRRDAGTYSGDYDHLARFGEWDDTDPVVEVDLT